MLFKKEYTAPISTPIPMPPTLAQKKARNFAWAVQSLNGMLDNGIITSATHKEMLAVAYRGAFEEPPKAPEQGGDTP